jgi:ABC-type polysaccharide/polyol phosphate export permease
MIGARLAPLAIRLTTPFVGSTRAQWLVARGYAIAYLVYFQLTAQYAKATLGILWVVMAPFLFLAVYLPVLTYVFQARFPEVSGPLDGALFLVVGYLGYAAFSDGFLQGASSIAHNPSAIQNSAAPAALLPVVKVTTAFVGLIATFLLYLAITLCAGRFPGVRLVLAPVAFGLFYIFTLGGAFLFSSIAVYFRDLLQLLPTLLLIEFFGCPIMYSPGMVHGRMALALEANPLTPFLALFRAALAPQATFAWLDLGLASAWAFGLLILGSLVFRKLQDGFSDAL